MGFKEIRRYDIADVAANTTARDARVARGRMYARLACRNGERGLSNEGLIRLAEMFDDGSIVTCAGWLHQMNVRRAHRS
jgi:hypothetical protein